MNASAAIARYVDNLLETPACKQAHNPWAIITGHLEVKLALALGSMTAQERDQFIALYLDNPAA